MDIRNLSFAPGCSELPLTQILIKIMEKVWKGHQNFLTKTTFVVEYGSSSPASVYD